MGILDFMDVFFVLAIILYVSFTVINKKVKRLLDDDRRSKQSRTHNQYNTGEIIKTPHPSKRRNQRNQQQIKNKKPSTTDTPSLEKQASLERLVKKQAARGKRPSLESASVYGESNEPHDMEYKFPLDSEAMASELELPFAADEAMEAMPNLRRDQMHPESQLKMGERPSLESASIYGRVDTSLDFPTESTSLPKDNVEVTVTKSQSRPSRVSKEALRAAIIMSEPKVQSYIK